eukprot:55785_1
MAEQETGSNSEFEISDTKLLTGLFIVLTQLMTLPIALYGVIFVDGCDGDYPVDPKVYLAVAAGSQLLTLCVSSPCVSCYVCCNVGDDINDRELCNCYCSYFMILFYLPWSILGLVIYSKMSECGGGDYNIEFCVAVWPGLHYGMFATYILFICCWYSCKNWEDFSSFWDFLSTCNCSMLYAMFCEREIWNAFKEHRRNISNESEEENVPMI